MSKVWVVNFAGHDYRKAEKYGEVVSITAGYVSMGSLDRVLFDVIDKLKKSSAEDWLLPSGLIAVNLVAVAVWLRMHGELRMLLWDRKYDTYRQMKATGEHIDYLIESLSNDQHAVRQEEEIRPEGS